MLTAKRFSTFSLALVLAGFLGQASWAQDEADEGDPVQQSFESIESSESSGAESKLTAQDWANLGEGVGADAGELWRLNPDYAIPAS